MSLLYERIDRTYVDLVLILVNILCMHSTITIIIKTKKTYLCEYVLICSYLYSSKAMFLKHVCFTYFLTYSAPFFSYSRFISKKITNRIKKNNLYFVFNLIFTDKN